ncbi:universal stress protein [Flavivirga jejuensis]|uniref:Universal stress protein n=1 Tax=Flavivirga jejuensis TaxID=870487 RepID=A0ABT8WLE0_9FLAO|nr:universal stress protein [Flavivirga jejuensis]MDO5973970.1 universal stress protein [Flavivirga jejuensis]
MKTILLPTDFSKNSMNSIDFALELFKDVTCDFYLLNVQKASSFICDDMMAGVSSTIYSTIIDTAKKSLSNIVSKAKTSHKNEKHRFHTMVDYDNFIDSINQVSDKNQVDLIVMGTKGASGLQKVVFGSNTVRVIQRCETPVLAIPDGCKFSDLSKVAFTTSFRSLYDLASLKPLVDIMSLHHSELCLLHIKESHNSSRELDKGVGFFDANFNDVIKEYIDANDKDIYSIIHEYVVKNEVKMLAMSNKKHSFLERLFNKHSVETFAFSIDVPFLVMKNN